MTSIATTPPRETVMQQAWRYQLWGKSHIKTCQGKTVEIVDAGKFNTGAGPDFKDARIRVDGKIWAGNIEIHRMASDWYRHGHHTDRAYDNVVLHVVGCDDCRVQSPDGNEILQTCMDVGTGFDSMFNSLLYNTRLVLPMCGDYMPTIKSVFKTDWITALAYERLYRKANDVLKRLEAESGNWLQTIFVTLARGLGYGVNADNMERTARSIPFTVLLKHTDNIETIEAILFGQAGLLNLETPRDEYEATLVREYKFYSHKYGLSSPGQLHWQHSSRSMSNTPWRRMAILARMVYNNGSRLGTSLYEAPSMQAIRDFLDIRLSIYWNYAFAFGRTSAMPMSALGKESRDLIVINVLVPIIFAHGLERGRYELLDAAVELLEKTDGEKNSITRGFRAVGIDSPDAFTSQALIQLHREYCERRRCLECRIGNLLLADFIHLGM